MGYMEERGALWAAKARVAELEAFEALCEHQRRRLVAVIALLDPEAFVYSGELIDKVRAAATGEPHGR